MKKTPEPIKQTPKKEPNYAAQLWVLVFTLVGLQIGIYFIMDKVDSNVAETNHLLSTFQRMDTVKDANTAWEELRKHAIDNGQAIEFKEDGSIHFVPLANSCAEGFLLINGQCIKTIEKATQASKEKTVCVDLNFNNECAKYNMHTPKGKWCGQVVNNGKENSCYTLEDASSNYNDPNLCKQWKTICKDGPVGPQCDVTCRIE